MAGKGSMAKAMLSNHAERSYNESIECCCRVEQPNATRTLREVFGYVGASYYSDFAS